MLHRLADVGPAAIAVVSCLSFQDALSLHVVALDDATRGLDAIARCLRYDSAAARGLSLEQGPDHLPLYMAVAHGCLVAAKRMRMQDSSRRGRKTSSFTRLLATYRPEKQDDDSQEDASTEHSSGVLSPSKKPFNRETRCQIMQWLNRHRPFIYPSHVMYTAASRGDMALVRWLHTTSVYEPHEIMEAAATHGHLEIAQFIYDVHETALIRHQLPPHRWTTIEMLWPLDECDLMSWVATVPGKPRHLNMYCKYADKAATTWYRCVLVTRPGKAMVKAQKGAVSTAMNQQRGSRIEPRATVPLDERNVINIPEQLAYEGKASTLALFDQACRRKFTTRELPWWARITSDAAIGAAHSGHLNVIKWLHEHHSGVFTPEIVDEAACEDHTHIVYWLYQNRSEGCTPQALEYAVSNGNFELMEFLMTRKGDELPVGMLEQAARSGDLELLTTQCDQKPPNEVGVKLMDEAIRCGHLHIAKWLYSNGCNSPSEHAFTTAVWKGDLDTVKWAHRTFPRLTCSLSCDNTLAESPVENCLGPATWLDSQTPGACIVDESIVRIALRQSCSPSFIEWLVKKLEKQRGTTFVFTRTKLLFGLRFQHETANTWQLLRWLAHRQPNRMDMFFDAAIRCGSAEAMAVLDAENRADGRPAFLVDPNKLVELAQNGSMPLARRLINAGRVDTSRHLTFRRYWCTTDRSLLLDEPPGPPLRRRAKHLTNENMLAEIACALVDANALEVYTPASAVSWAAYYGCKKVLSYLLSRFPGEFRSEGVLQLVMLHTRAGGFVIQMLTNAPNLATLDVVQWAVRYQQIELLGWLLQYSSLTRSHVARAIVLSACQHGHLNVLKWLISLTDASGTNQAPVTHRAFVGSAISVARNGHDGVLPWLAAQEEAGVLSSTGVRDTSDLMSMACRMGHLGVVQWLWKHIQHASDGVMNEHLGRWINLAHGNGHFEISAWLAARGEYITA